MLNALTERRWWRREADPHVAIHGQVSRQLEMGDRRDTLQIWAALYADEQIDADEDETGIVRRRRARHNVTQNGVDAVHSRITKSRPRPWVVTTGGDYAKRQQAEMLSRWLDGQFERLDMYELGEEVFLDAEVFGTGVAKVYHRDGDIRVERVYVEDLLVDPREEAAGSIRSMYQIAAVDREVLAERWPEFRSQIEDAKRWTDEGREYRHEDELDEELAADMVLVVEAWRLPAGPGSPGRHCICIDQATLYSEDWERDEFPFVFLRWAKHPRRFWGIGLVERMAGTQAELNSMTEVISESYGLMIPQVWIEAGSKVNVEKLDDVPYSVHYYTGQPPVFMSPPPIARDFIDREDSLTNSVYEDQGISQLSATSQKPAGLDSGRALLVHQDVEAERFMVVGRAYERWFVDIAKQLIAVAEDIVAADDIDADEKLEVFGTKRNGGAVTMQAVKFSDARFGDEPHIIQIYPVSKLSQSPEGRLRNIAELQQIGALQDPLEIRRLLDMPDLDEANDIDAAARDLTDKQIADCLDGEAVAANPYLDLQYAHRRAILSLLLAERENASPAGLRHLRNYIGTIEAIQKKAQAEQQAAAMAAQAAMAPQPGPPPPVPGPI